MTAGLVALGAHLGELGDDTLALRQQVGSFFGEPSDFPLDGRGERLGFGDSRVALGAQPLDLGLERTALVVVEFEEQHYRSITVAQQPLPAQLARYRTGDGSP